jgi:hypothetical protein
MQRLCMLVPLMLDDCSRFDNTKPDELPYLIKTEHFPTDTQVTAY